MDLTYYTMSIKKMSTVTITQNRQNIANQERLRDPDQSYERLKLSIENALFNSQIFTVRLSAYFGAQLMLNFKHS